MNEKEWQKIIKVLTQIFISLLVVGTALYIILSAKYPDSYNKWAFGIVGVIVGYWLR